MLPKTEKPLQTNDEVSEEMQHFIEDALRNEFEFIDSKSVLKSIDKIYLFDKHTEEIYSKFASKLMILLFIFDYSRKLNSRIEDKYKIEAVDIHAIIKEGIYKYYKDQAKDLEKDKLISWFINEGLPNLDDCLDRKQYTKLRDVINIGINLDLLKEYSSRIENESDFYEILSQFTKAFEKYPATIRKREILVYIRDEDIHGKTTITHGPIDTNVSGLRNVEWQVADAHL